MAVDGNRPVALTLTWDEWVALTCAATLAASLGATGYVALAARVRTGVIQTVVEESSDSQTGETNG